MLFVTDKKHSLKEIVFQKHLSIKADELNILTGYIGSSTIEEAHNLDIKINVVYGLARHSKLKKVFHSDLCKLQTKQTKVYCPEILSHAKIYIWKYRKKVVYVLNGSANFSRSGLETPLKEVLSEVHPASFKQFSDYFESIFQSSKLIDKIDFDKFGANEDKFSDTRGNSTKGLELDPNICISYSLYAKKSKINWGHGNANTTPRDAYIPIRKQDIVNYPQLFPEKADNKGLGYNDNAPIEILWDDGIRMPALLEGSLKIDGLRYPNKISSFRSKKTMGDYLRRRMGLTEGKFVTRQMFENYGRDNISISLLGEGVYFMDFSV